jgi:Family of unknown function (DUF6174)
MTTRRAAGAAVAIVAVALLVGCSSSTSQPSGPAELNRPYSSTTTSASQASAFTGPRAAYTYRLVASCGERSGLGTFDVTVRHGRVVRVDPRGRSSQLLPDERPLMTLDGFFVKAEQARLQGAEKVLLTMRAGHVDTLSIDWATDTIDDEFCWHASHVRVT